jgi:hypothetical protein
MRGEVLGTPRHPFKKTVTSFLMFSLFAKPKFVGFYYVQMSRFPSYDIPKMVNVIWLRSVLIRLFISPSFIFVSFKFPGISVVGYT